MVTPAVNSVPVPATPRGKRPKNRRGQIRTAASALFYERGYEQVSIAEVAASVNVGPSALYRHFSGKADLLYEAIDETITAFAAMVDDLPSRDLEGLGLTAARTALTHRPLGVLWQREARNLPAEQQAVLRRHLRVANSTLATTLRELRPDLDVGRSEFLAACSVNAMSSISFHRLELPADQFEEVLAELALRMLAFTFPGTSLTVAPQQPPPPAATRRDEIAEAAAPLFARHGFDAVSVDDIGAAVGIAGPSIYNHFSSKQELLYTSLTRGWAVLQNALADALDSPASPEEVLRRVSDSYVDMTHDHTDLVTNLIVETRNLGPEYAEVAQLAQLGYIGQWVALVQQLRPDEPLTVSRLKVQAAQMMANSIARTGYLRQHPDLKADLADLCWLLQQ